jgi:lysophospholipase L1-like esterase
MDCRRRLRLGSGPAIVLAAALVSGSPIDGSAEPRSPQAIFESRPQVEALRCPSDDRPSSRKPAAPRDRIPAADELSAAAIAAGGPLHSATPPRLSPDVVRRFGLPQAGGDPLRVGVWGDSHVAAGFITDELAKAIEARGLTVATRFVPASVGRPGIRLPVRHVCKGGGWRFEPAYTAPGPIHVGPALASLRSTKTGDYLWLDLRQRADRHVRGVRIHYFQARGASAIGVRVDDGPERRFDLAQPGEHQPAAPGVLDLRASSSISTLKLRVVQGSVLLQGFSLDDASTPDVTIDVFGLPSATVNGWSNADPEYLRKSIDADSYGAIILEYGTNEGAVGRFDSPKYAAMLASSLENMRLVFPDAACVLMGPTDRGVRIPQAPPRARVDFLRYSRIHQQIARIQNEVGAKFGCVLWDWQRSMGGTGSIYAWARATPPLAAADLIHLTLAGYRRSAASLAQSLGWIGPDP